MKSETKKEIIVTVVCSILVATVSVASALIARQEKSVYEVKPVPTFDLIKAADYFPLKKGNSWSYAGTAVNATAGGSEVQKEVELTMRVVDVVERRGVTFFIMEGHPADAAWALEEGDRSKRSVEIKPSKYGYLLISNKLFKIAEDKMSVVSAALQGDGFVGLDMLSEEDIEMEMPLFKGLRFGEIKQLGRADLSYFWYVNDVTVFHDAEGDKIVRVPLYTVAQNTRPDYTEYTFRPYLGITTYTYSHHGTKAHVELSLGEFSLH